jgi:20S proteasome alpha/beta subunit
VVKIEGSGLIMLFQNIVNRLSLFIQAYTLYSSVRPFGCSSILAAVDKNGPGLYVIEPSGISLVSGIQWGKVSDIDK